MKPELHRHPPSEDNTSIGQIRRNARRGGFFRPRDFAMSASVGTNQPPALRPRPEIRGEDRIDGPWTFNRENIKTSVIHGVGPGVFAVEIASGDQSLRQVLKAWIIGEQIA